MVRQTSTDAYDKIKHEGLLSAKRWQAYDALFHHGPFTASEGAAYVKGIRKNDLSSRLTELVKMGVVQEIQERQCQVTKQNVIEFDVTDAVPEKIERSIRSDENTGDPIVINLSNLRRIAHKELTDEIGELMKIRLNTSWVSAFNSWVLDKFLECVEVATDDDRYHLLPEDIPGWEPSEESEEYDDEE